MIYSLTIGFLMYWHMHESCWANLVQHRFDGGGGDVAGGDKGGGGDVAGGDDWGGEGVGGDEGGEEGGDESGGDELGGDEGGDDDVGGNKGGGDDVGGEEGGGDDLGGAIGGGDDLGGEERGGNDVGGGGARDSNNRIGIGKDAIHGFIRSDTKHVVAVVTCDPDKTITKTDNAHTDMYDALLIFL
ncbi:hypothetical protein L6452_15408 [Arctium lappa]|uniref:Uncharacterized protein n=2 Tax=Arctium lappa TaxID=4217 RepID=A0ACB9CNP4_ARCLA|nr:hypothetical protein L6452_15405 [Arctium lappa]KAI3735885.1 hypothetical protein L6452_15408 [Arctium lappa]